MWSNVAHGGNFRYPSGTALRLSLMAFQNNAKIFKRQTCHSFKAYFLLVVFLGLLSGFPVQAAAQDSPFAFPSTTALRSSANPSPDGAPIVFTAVVASIKVGPLPPPTGSVIFSDGTTTLATETLIPSGAASYANYTAPSLSQGSHIITATYVPDAVFATSTVSLTQVIGVATVPDFALTSPPVVTVVAEHHTSINLNVTSVGGFRGVVQLACGPLPPHAVCFFDQGNTVNLEENGTGSVLVDLETSDVKGFKSETQNHSTAPLLALLPAAALAFFRRRRLPRLLATILFAGSGLLLLSGCSGKLPGFTPPGTYTFQITGFSGSLTHTNGVKLVVSPEE